MSKISLKTQTDNIEKKSYVIYLIAVFVSLAIAGLVIYLLKDLPEKYNLQELAAKYNLNTASFIPERHEFLQYALGTLIFPIMFCVSFKILSLIKFKNLSTLNISEKIVRSIELLMIFGAAVFADLIFQKNWIENIFSIFTLFVLILIFYFQQVKGIWEKIFYYIFGAAEITVLLYIAFLYVTKNYFINDNVWHFDAYYYPVFEVFNGKTLITDLSGLYGYYPYIIAPILKLFGQINMFNFSIVMAVLVLITFGCIAGFIWQNTRNKVLSLIGLMAILFVSNPFYVLEKGQYYLQYTPHRMIGSTLLLLICSLYVNSKQDKFTKILTVAGYIVSAFSLFWNIETGVVVIAAWTLFLLYQILVDYNSIDKKLFLKGLKVLGFTAISVAGTYLILMIITFARSGQFITPSDTVASQSLFFGSGFFMLPMPFPHYWMLLILIFVFGLAKSLRNIFFLRPEEKEFSKGRSSMYFLVSVMGLGLFSYYQGRSHDEVFNFVVWPGIILAVLFAQDYLAQIFIKRNKNDKLKFDAFKTTLFVLKSVLISSMVIGFAVLFVTSTFTKIDIKNLQDNTSYSVPAQRTEVVDFLKSYLDKGRQIDLIMQYNDEYYTMLGIKNPTPIGAPIDWFTKDDYKKIFDWLGKTKGLVFVDPYCKDLFNTFSPKEFSEAIKGRFREVDSFRDITVYEVITN
ncbi:MAG: hypothetical protein WCQ41_05810 [Bacillota bacterium]